MKPTVAPTGVGEARCSRAVVIHARTLSWSLTASLSFPLYSPDDLLFSCNFWRFGVSQDEGLTVRWAPGHRDGLPMGRA